jgi:hypothetical protein
VFYEALERHRDVHHRAPAAGDPRWARRVLAVGGVLAILAAGCSDNDDDDMGRGSQSTTTVASTSTTPRPEGPTADVTERITGKNAPFMGEAAPPDLEKVGYVEEEFAAEGTATAYRAEGSLSTDGRWSFAPDTTADYRTRILVRRPAQAADFSGTVLIEWLNVSGGVDGNPDYAYMQDELVRQGHAWVGVSAACTRPRTLGRPAGDWLRGSVWARSVLRSESLAPATRHRCARGRIQS